MLIRYFPTIGDKHGWAIDEDRRLIRRALHDVAQESSLWRADVVHSPFWMALAMHHPRVLQRKFVIAHADNPPFFYLTQPEFAKAQKTVDLWVARSHEALEQFSALGLPAAHVPYAIDEALFFPIPDRAGLRAKYGIPREAYIIGNFHRDTEGSDLSKPKLQKAPETLVAILRIARSQGLHPHILLAGPRRHWLRKALAREGIPFTFVGNGDTGEDDFGTNILSREQLNELYNTCDLYLVPSRWEGGPQSAMEAASARVKTLSFPLGVARDILEGDSLFDTPAQAAAKIAKDMNDGFLASTLDAQRNRLLANHTATAMASGLQRIYHTLPERMAGSHRPTDHLAAIPDLAREVFWKIRCRRRRELASSVKINHATGMDVFMDEAVSNLVGILKTNQVSTEGTTNDPVVSGSSQDPSRYRILPAGGSDICPNDDACRIALSVQDAVNFKSAGNTQAVVVCPLVFEGGPSVSDQLVVDENNRGASLDIWRCMHAAGCVVYPRSSAYYYQVFHGGVPFGGLFSKKEAIKAVNSETETLRALARPPSRESAAAFWKTLLNQ